MAEHPLLRRLPRRQEPLRSELIPLPDQLNAIRSELEEEGHILPLAVEYDDGAI